MAYFAIVYQSNKNKIKNSVAFLLFRVVEIHRICETTATPRQNGLYGKVPA